MKTFCKWALIVAASNLFAAAVIYGEDWEPSETQTLLASLNDTYRVSRGLDPHQLDAECCSIAQRWAETMAARHSMYHGGGEQIVAYNGGSATHCMGMWRASGGHNYWLLSGTTRAGWGHAISSSGNHYWAGAFRGAVAVVVSPETRSERRGFLGRIFGGRR